MTQIYLKQCSPIIECVGFLEYYVMEESYLHTVPCLMQGYQGPFAQEDILKQLDEIKHKMGSWMDQHVPQARIWFTQLQEGMGFSLFKAYIMEVYDHQLSTEQQIAHMRQRAIDHPNHFLRFVLILLNEDEKHSLMDVPYEQLLQRLEQQDLSDEIKWRIMKLHLTLPKIIDEFQMLMNGLLPIYHSYETLLQELLQLYLKDYEQYQDNLLNHFTKKHNLQFQAQDRTQVILPTVAYGISFTYHESDLDASLPSLVLWGVDVLNAARSIGASTTSEGICSVLKVLSDKSKFEILCFLSKNKTAYATEIAKTMNLTTATISYHMQALINTHLIKLERINNRLYYSINETQLKQFLQDVEHHILQS